MLVATGCKAPEPGQDPDPERPEVTTANGKHGHRWRSPQGTQERSQPRLKSALKPATAQPVPDPNQGAVKPLQWKNTV